jgi:hypothetical protein
MGAGWDIVFARPPYLAPLYQRPPAAECPATGFSALLKVLVKANLLLSCCRLMGASEMVVGSGSIALPQAAAQLRPP